MTAIRASFVKYNMLADGTLRVVFDVHPTERKIATDLLQQPGDPFAFARMTEESVLKAAQNETIAAAKEPTGQLCREAIGYCKNPQFYEWLETLGYPSTPKWDENGAKEVLLEICQGVDQLHSRRDLDLPGNAEQFIENIRNPYREWVKEQAHDFGNSAK